MNSDPALIIALRKKRMADMAGDDGGHDSGTSSQSGDMEKYWAMMQDMNGKLDKLISLLSDEEPHQQDQEGAAKSAY